MQTYDVKLEAKPAVTFRTQKAANSVDLDIEKKLSHRLTVKADLETPFNIGLIVGSSGSGKTTLAEKIYGKEVFTELLKLDTPIIEQFPKSYTYDDCTKALCAAGLSQVPCWLKPAGALSNGQKARAEIALQLASDREIIVIDEFTSVVDRVVAKVMALNIQKMARKQKKQIVLVSCHYDIIEWLNPCWIIDCNKQTYEDRRAFFLTTKGKKNSNLKLENAMLPVGNTLANIII